jgi:hypothetical protein
MAQTLRVLDGDALTVREITERVYAKATLSYQMRMAVSEALAQLACLRKRGGLRLVVADISPAVTGLEFAPAVAWALRVAPEVNSADPAGAQVEDATA